MGSPKPSTAKSVFWTILPILIIFTANFPGLYWIWLISQKIPFPYWREPLPPPQIYFLIYQTDFDYLWYKFSWTGWKLIGRGERGGLPLPPPKKRFSKLFNRFWLFLPPPIWGDAYPPSPIGAQTPTPSPSKFIFWTILPILIVFGTIAPGIDGNLLVKQKFPFSHLKGLPPPPPP